MTYNKTEHQGPQSRFRKSIFDLTCTNQDGDIFIIEIQRLYQAFFKDRAIYYTSTLIHEQGPKGNARWDFKLKEIYLLALMDFNFEDSEPENYLHYIHLADANTGKPFYEKLGYVFIELPKFTKQESALKTDLDKWLFILKNMSKLQKIPVFLVKRVFEKLFAIAEISKLTKEDYMQYEKSLMAKWDEYAIIKTAEEKGLEKGIEKGAETKGIKVVKNLLSAGTFTETQIANLADVSVNFVKKVKKTLQL